MRSVNRLKGLWPDEPEQPRKPRLKKINWEAIKDLHVEQVGETSITLHGTRAAFRELMRLADNHDCTVSDAVSLMIVEGLRLMKERN